MGKAHKKKFIDKKAAVHYHLVHRSQQDAAHENDEAPSNFVLVPADKRGDFERARASHRDLEEEEGERREWQNYLRTGELQPRGNHVTPLGLPNDGYDYERHMKVMGGGTFVTSKGRLAASSRTGAKPTTAALPAEALPSEELLERQFESITISDAVMDADMRAAIAGGDASDFEALDDDFVLQAAGGAEGDGDAPEPFDFDAHVARLIAASERTVGLRSERLNRRSVGGEHGESDSGSDEDEEDRSIAEEQREGGEDDVEALFDKALEEYGSDEWGSLDLEAEELKGQRDVQTDGLLDQCCDEFLERNKSLSWTVEGALGAERSREAVSASKARASVLGPLPEASDEGVRAVFGVDFNPSDLRGSGNGGADDMEEDLDDADGKAAVERSFTYLQRPLKEKWDCETIVSTYSTLDNHPTVLSLGAGSRRRRGRRGSNAEADDHVGRASALRPSGETRVEEETAAADVEATHSSSAGDDKRSDGGNDDLEARTARTRGETADEKRARKLRVKEEKRSARERKRGNKELFRASEAAAARIAANSETAHRRSVFAYS